MPPYVENAVGYARRLPSYSYYVSSGLVTIINLSVPLYMSQMFLFFLFVIVSLVLCFKYVFFLFLRCSDYLP
jgi:hypothetical protein